MASEKIADLPFHTLRPPQPHKKIGSILIGLSYAMPIILYLATIYWFFNFNKSSNFDDIYLLLILMISFSLYASRVLSNYGGALRQQDAIDLINTDSRAPILYLRSFNDDSVPDYTGSIIPLGPNQTVEMRLAHVFKGVGPVISIGIPGEILPELGANRFYVSDNDWKQAVQYFLDKAAVVIILVGKSTGIKWEISTALHSVPIDKILLVFPYLITVPKGRINRWMQSIGMKIDNYSLKFIRKDDDRLDKGLLDQLQEERDTRYAAFRAEFGNLFEKNLPQDLGSSIFIDFTKDGYARLIPTRKPLFIRRMRDQQGVTFDYERTLRPFIEKIRNYKIQLDWLERILTSRVGLLAITLFCAFAAMALAYLQFFIYLLSDPIVAILLGVIIFFLAFLAINAFRNLINSSHPDNQGVGFISHGKATSPEQSPSLRPIAAPASCLQIKITRFNYIVLFIALLISIVNTTIEIYLSYFLSTKYGDLVIIMVMMSAFEDILIILFLLIIVSMKYVIKHKISRGYLNSHNKRQYNTFSLWILFGLLQFLLSSFVSLLLTPLSIISILWHFWLIYRLKLGYYALNAHEDI